MGGSGSVNTAQYAYVDNRGNKKGHLVKMSGKYSQLPQYLTALRESIKPPAMNTDEIETTQKARACVLSVAEATDMELHYSKLIEKCRSNIENALNGHFGGGSLPSSQSQSQNSCGGQGQGSSSDHAVLAKDALL